MKVKTITVAEEHIGQTMAVVDGKGLPVIVRDGGKEESHDPAAAIAAIKAAREAQEEAEASAKEAQADLAKWSKLGDLSEVRKAVRTVAALGEADLDAAKAPEEIARLREESEELRHKVGELEGEIKTRDERIWDLDVGQTLASSGWLRENVISPLVGNVDALKSLFGRHFRQENGHIQPYDAKGEPLKILDSETNKLRPMTVEEALPKIVGDTWRKPAGTKTPDIDPSKPSGQMTFEGASYRDLKDDTERRTAYIEKFGEDAYQALALKDAHERAEKIAQTPSK